MIGQTLSHYRVLQQIGAGGMGVVYLARDERLERDVAVKVLPSGLLADEAARKRFRKEALTLSKLNHPNIATIFDFDSAGQTDFLVTEYVAGVTLDAKLAPGPLQPKEAVGLGIQLTQGLAAAHAQGIVHRDLKPGNLRLTVDGRLKILDFGLAQLVQPETDLVRTVSLTASQQITGTLPYMAPEQLRGEPTDARSDLWAAGAVLYEMVTGKRPFPETNGPLLIDAILHQTPEPPSKLNRQVPTGLENIILKALEKNPVERYQSSRELGADLERLTLGVSPLAAVPAQRLRRRLMAAGALLLLLVMAFAGYLVTRRQRVSGPVSVNVRRSVAVLGFKNLSGRPDTAWLSTALSEMLTTELAAGEKLLTISGENVARVKTDLSLPETDTLAPDTLTRVRKNLGSDFVVLGSYLDLGGGTDDQIRLDLRLQDAVAGQTIAVVSDKGTLSQLDELVTRAGARLRDKLGAGEIPASEETAARAARPANLQAARFYSEGLEKFRTSDAMAARDLLQKAVAADPTHAGSRASLAAAWSLLGYDAKAREAAKQAFDLAASLPREERLRVEGQYYEEDNQWDKAISTYRSLFESEPDNVEYGLKLANTQVFAGKANEALATIAELRKLPPPQRDDLRIDLAEARAAHSLSDFKREQTLSGSVAERGEKQGARFLVARARLAQCGALRNLGDAKSAIPECQKAERIFAEAGDRFAVATVLNSIGNALYDHGDLAAARRAYEEVVKIDHEIGNQSGLAGALDNIASVAQDQGDLATAKKLSEQALAIYRETGDKINIAATLNNIATGLVLEGGLAESQKMFEESLAIGREIGSDSAVGTALVNLGEVRLDQGDAAGSKTAYAEALAIFQRSGEKGKTSYPLVGLGDALSATGDLAAAKNRYEQALAASRESGEKHQSAMALAGLGTVLMRQGDVGEARKRYEEALALRKELDEKDAVADSLFDLARLTLEEGRTAEAEAALRQLVPTPKMPDHEAAVRAVLAQALVAQGRLGEARQQITLGKTITAKTQRRGTRLQMQIAAARVQAASAKPADLDSAAAALSVVIHEAEKIGFVDQEFEARLELGEIEIKSGKTAAGGTRLEALEKDARAKGFVLMAGKAARAHT